MTRLEIDPGACGLPTRVSISSKGGRLYRVEVESECEMIRKLGSEISELTMMDAFKRVLENPVYRAGGTCLKHVSCPVPAGILKALEVEAGLAVPKDVSMRFLERDGQEERDP